jgi:hypothetical protein
MTEPRLYLVAIVAFALGVAAGVYGVPRTIESHRNY